MSCRYGVLWTTTHGPKDEWSIVEAFNNHDDECSNLPRLFCSFLSNSYCRQSNSKKSVVKNIFRKLFVIRRGPGHSISDVGNNVDSFGTLLRKSVPSCSMFEGLVSFISDWVESLGVHYVWCQSCGLNI